MRALFERRVSQGRRSILFLFSFSFSFLCFLLDRSAVLRTISMMHFHTQSVVSFSILITIAQAVTMTQLARRAETTIAPDFIGYTLLPGGCTSTLYSLHAFLCVEGNY